MTEEEDFQHARQRFKHKIKTVVMGLMSFVICAIIFTLHAHSDHTAGFILASLSLAGMLFLQFTLPKIIADVLMPD